MQDFKPQNHPHHSIESSVISGILSAQIRPGARLGESELASLFGVSRTIIREAMMRLQSRGIVNVKPRRGWYVIRPSAEEAMKVYSARRVIEFGLLRNMRVLSQEGRRILEDHLTREKSAMAGGDRQRLTVLMGDFHIRIAEIAGNSIIVDLLRDLTARTVLVSMLYQSDFHAAQSHEGHCRIYQAMLAGDFNGAAEYAIQHLDEVETGLDLSRRLDPLAELRSSLSLPAAPVVKKGKMTC